jgi:galactose mutarotase-like enzyme
MDLFTIQNEYLRVSVHNRGGELRSLTDLATGHEYMWNGDTSVWSGVAPVLFPVVGRLSGDRFRESHNAYPHPKHGFLRTHTLSAEVVSDHELRFTMRSDAQTLLQYPFDFRFTVGYRLQGRTVTQYFEVENTGPRSMVFALGGHPAFAIPMQDNGDITDYYLDFETTEAAPVYSISPDGLLTGQTAPAPWRDARYIDITRDLFNDDALVFRELNSRSVTLRSKKHDRKVRVDFDDFPYLGIWAKPGARYVCIEPWIGCADEGGAHIPFRRKPGVRELDGHARVSLQFCITV